MATKLYCDACGMEILGTEYKMTIQHSNTTSPDYKLDLCYACEAEIISFTFEVCKLHARTKADDGLQELKWEKEPEK